MTFQWELETNLTARLDRLLLIGRYITLMATSQIDEVISSIIDDINGSPQADVTTYRRLAPVYDLLYGESYDYELQTDYIRKNAPKSPDFSVLEAGCGTGRLLKSLGSAFPEADIHGVDLNEEMVQIARDRIEAYKNIDVTRTSVFEVDGQYDLVAGFSLLPHFDEEATKIFFRHAASILVDEGTLVFDYKDPRNNPDGRYDIWEAETEKFLVTARFLTVYENSSSYYAVSYEFEKKATQKRYTTGELMDIFFHHPKNLAAKLQAAGFQSIEVTPGVGDQSGVIEATK